MKLLDKSIRAFLIYAAIILIIAIPVIYFVVQEIVREDVDEAILAKKSGIVDKLKHLSVAGNNEKKTFFDPDLTIEADLPPLARDSLYNISVYDSASRENIPYRVLESPIPSPSPLRVRIKNSLVDSDDLILSIVSIVGGILVLIIAGLLVISRNLSIRLWKPFYGTLEQLWLFRLDNKSNLRLIDGGIEEFRSLNKSLEMLLATNQRLYQSQKEFTENASHEMQTPLAILNGNIELMIGTVPLTADQAQLLTNMQVTTNRMRKLNKTLILLARIDNSHFPEKEKLFLTQVIEKLIHQYSDAIVQKNITVLTSFSHDLELEANRDLVEILLGNLISNAIRHNEPLGTIRVVLQADQLSIYNSSVESPLNEALLFKRFQKQGSKNQSPGLGLAIAWRICEISGYSLSYKNELLQHCFSINFNSVKAD